MRKYIICVTYFLKKKCKFATIIRMNINLLKMKKLLLTVIATIMMAASISAQNVAKECVLVEAFTGIRCPACPAAAGAISEMLNNGLSVAALAFHCNYYSKEYATPETESRGLSFYEVTAYPSVFIDGTKVSNVGGPSNYSNQTDKLLKAEYDKKVGVKSPYKVELTYDYNSWNSLNAKAVVTKVGECNGNDVRLFIALAESHIQQEWAGGNEINAVVRDIVTDDAGIELLGEKEEITALFDVRPYKKENCELVAWVQDVVSKEVYQAVKISVAPTAEYDVAILYDVENLPSGSCSGIASPIITIENQGSQPLTSVAFNVTNEDGDILGTYKWEGALEKNASTNYELSDIKFGGAGVVNIEAVELNDGINDKYTFDNTIVYEVHPSYILPDDGVLAFQVRTSEPENVTIDVLNMSKGGALVKTLTFSSTSAIKESYTLPEHGCYRIVINNSKGNGIGDINSLWGILDSKKGKIEVAGQGEKLFRYKYAVEVSYGSVGVEDVVAEENINVYPNPAKSVVNVYAENLNKITVYNSIGQMVYTQVADSDNMMINVELWTNGLYYINLETKSGATTSQKVIVNK